MISVYAVQMYTISAKLQIGKSNFSPAREGGLCLFQDGEAKGNGLFYAGNGFGGKGQFVFCLFHPNLSGVGAHIIDDCRKGR